MCDHQSAQGQRLPEIGLVLPSHPLTNPSIIIRTRRLCSIIIWTRRLCFIIFLGKRLVFLKNAFSKFTELMYYMSTTTIMQYKFGLILVIF
jgi:hypothetical protein